MNQNGFSQHYRTHRRSKADIQRILEEYRGSGLSQRAFAARNQLSLSNLQYWLRQSKRQGMQHAQPQWLEVSVPAPARAAKVGLTYQIVLAGGILSIPSGFDPEELKHLLALVGQPA